jgi:hypothetical protein
MKWSRSTALSLILTATLLLVSCSLLPQSQDSNFKPSRESIDTTNSDICGNKLSGSDAKTDASQVLTDDTEAQKIKDILTQLGLALNLDATTGCKVDQGTISGAGL